MAGTITRNEVIAADTIIPKNILVVVVSSGKECKNKDWEEGQREVSGKREKQIWDVVGDAGHDVGRNEERKKVLKKRLAELIRAVRTLPQGTLDYNNIVVQSLFCNVS